MGEILLEEYPGVLEPICNVDTFLWLDFDS